MTEPSPDVNPSYKNSAEVPETVADATGAAPARARAIPDRIGRYHILRLLAEGGMGAVYEAEQEHPHRLVALKVIKTGYADQEMIRRFEQESQALGRLQHPGIAQIYEAGQAETAAGTQPYFAMEMIHGLPLVRYANERNLSVRERLLLLARTCEAVHHAHQRGLIHRDLKPGNILVDETGQPKILDFGIAQMTDSDAELTRQTSVGQLIGTLSYMSPEQVMADPYEIDTRSDVYALGVILYELLAGKLPYNLSQKPLHEAVQIIREQEPTRLSSGNRLYRGDVETIVAKALEKDKTRRYASAAGLAADIRRYLNDEPITAHPPSALYQLQKLARRNRTAVAGILAVFFVLVAGVIVSSVESLRAKHAEVSARQAEVQAESQRDRAVVAEREATDARDRALKAEVQSKRERDKAVAERRRADNEAATATAISNFLQNDLLQQASAVGQGPGAKANPNITVRTVLDRAAGRIGKRFVERPQVEGSIEATIGTAYWNIGVLGAAKEHLERALQLLRRTLGDDNAATLAVAETLGETYRSAGDYRQAESLLHDTVDAYVRSRGADDPGTLKAMGALAGVYVMEGKMAEAQTLLTDVLARDRRVLGEDNETTLDTMGVLARVDFMSGKLTETEQLLLAVIAGQKRTFGPEHPYTINTMNNLAVLYQREGRYADAEKLYAKVIDIRRRVEGPDHPETLNSLNNLGVLYAVEGKYAQAEALYDQVLKMWRKQLGPDHPRTLSVMSNLAVLKLGQRKYAEAEALAKSVLDTRTRVLGAEHVDTLTSMRILGDIYESEGKYAEAEPLYTKALEIRRRVSGPRNGETLAMLTRLGELRLDQKRYSEAETLLRECLEVQKQTMPDNYKLYWTENLLGASLAGEQKYAEAEPLLVSGYEGMKEKAQSVSDLDRQELRKAGERVMSLYMAWGKADKATEWKNALAQP